MKKGDRWGYIDHNGKEKIPARYRSAGAFSEGLAAVRLDGTFGYIDESGSIAIPYRYDYAEPFIQGIATAYIKGKPYLIDRGGKALFGHNFTRITASGHNRLWIVQSPGGRFGIINQSGQLILDTLYAGISPFIAGKATIRRRQRIPENDRFEYDAAVVNSKGAVIIPFGTFKSIRAVNDSYFLATYKRDDDYHLRDVYLNSVGKPTLTPSTDIWYLPDDEFRPGLNHVGIWNKARDSKGYIAADFSGVIDPAGNLLFSDSSWTNITPFSEGRAFVEKRSGKQSWPRHWIMIDETGSQISNKTFEQVFHNSEGNPAKQRKTFINGKAFVAVGSGMWTAIDTNANYLFDPIAPGTSAKDGGSIKVVERYGDIVVFQNEAANYRYGFWDPENGILIRPQYNQLDIDSSHHNLIRIITNNQEMGYLTRQGKLLWKEPKLKSTISPVNIDYMARGYFHASGPARKELAGFGGWGNSDNKAKSIQPATPFKRNDLSIVISNTAATWQDAYPGRKVYLANTSHDTMYFPAQDSRLHMNVQARDGNGLWRDIEYLPNSWCGNSYHTVALNPKQYWDFTMPVYEGVIKTKLRIRLEYRLTSQLYEGNSNEVLYSNEVDGSVNPAQFWRKREYFPAGLMDPYDE